MTDEAKWRVVDQRQTIAQNDAGQYVPTVAVSVRLPSGTVLTVNVPTADYTADAVRAAIEEAVGHYTAVDELHG